MKTLIESKEYMDLIDANRQFRRSLQGFSVAPKPVIIRKCAKSKNFVNVMISRELHGSLKFMKGRKSFNNYIRDLIKSQTISMTSN
jgi:hypothetical protein